MVYYSILETLLEWPIIMLNFDPSKLRSSYVYITQVTNDYVHVAHHRNGEPYRPESGQLDPKTGHTKIRINKQVAHTFMNKKGSPVRKFSTPRLASINYYGGQVMSIELKPVSNRIMEKNWRSGFSKLSADLCEKLSLPEYQSRQVRFDGKSISWDANVASNEQEMRRNDFILDHDSDGNRLGHYRLRQVESINLMTMGLLGDKNINMMIQDEKSVELSSDELMEFVYRNYGLSVKNGMSLVYMPDPDGDIEAYSPVIGANDGQLTDRDKAKEKERLRGIYSLCSSTKPSFINLDFVLEVGKTIGKLYGQKANDFFDIPSILEDIGEVNFHNINKSSRMTYPVQIEAKTAVAWLLGFMHREQDPENLRILGNTISKSLVENIITTNEIDRIYKRDNNRDMVLYGSIEAAHRGVEEIAAKNDLVAKQLAEMHAEFRERLMSKAPDESSGPSL